MESKAAYLSALSVLEKNIVPDLLKVAKSYFKKQFSESVTETEKDKLFKNYIAVYKFDPSTGFDKLSFLHK